MEPEFMGPEFMGPEFLGPDGLGTRMAYWVVEGHRTAHLEQVWAYWKV
jgi:hypothetical protein